MDHLPSWMDQSKDMQHQAETESLLFGTQTAAAAAEAGGVTATEQPTYGAKTTTTTTTTTNMARETQNHPRHADRNKDDADKTPTKGGGRNNRRNQSFSLFSKTPKQPNDPTNPEPQKLPKEASMLLWNKPHMPHQNPCLWMFHFLNGSAVVSALCIILTQISPYFFGWSQQYHFTSFFSVLNLGLKCYIVLFCILFVLVEVDMPWTLLRNSQLLQGFFSRGFLYSFLGLISTVESYSGRVESFLDTSSLSSSRSYQDYYQASAGSGIFWSDIFMQVSAWLMLAVGCVYMMLGMCCMKRVRDVMHEREQQAWRMYRQELRQWKQRRELYGTTPHNITSTDNNNNNNVV